MGTTGLGSRYRTVSCVDIGVKQKLEKMSDNKKSEPVIEPGLRMKSHKDCSEDTSEVACGFAKCKSSRRNHKTRNLFSLGNGLILVLLFLLYWTCTVHGGFPGRGPPPRGPPLLPHHPLAPGGPHLRGQSRNSPFGRRRAPPPHPHHGHRHGPPHKPGKNSKSSGPSDLAVAAQTLYDLRGFHLPITAPEAPRYHRQNDPFTMPTPLSSNPRDRKVSHLQQDSRTAPLVFPSFFQDRPTPTPTRSIFGHSQHLSQTRFEPPTGFHLGGNSASTKITLEQQSSSSRDQFRPSQIDISLHNNQVSTPLPASPLPFAGQPQSQNVLATNQKALATTLKPRTQVKLSKTQPHDPFVYVYDEVDYDEGEDNDFTLGNRQRTPQGQINSNRITPAPSTTTAPLRGREPTIVTTQNPFANLQQQPQYLHQGHQALFQTTSTTKQPTTTQNNIYYNPQKDDYRDPFGEAGIIRPPVTPRPNVEIVPSSERKPPPDQSNAIVPALSRLRNEGRDYNRGVPTFAPPQSNHQIPLINDNFRRQPVHQTTTTVPPQYQRESIYNNQPQGRQVSPSPSPVPYFPSGLDRRPFETQNEIPSAQQPVRNGQTQQHFDQVVNLLQEEEEQYSSQNNNNPAENLLDQGYNTPSKLRPVNTIIPKNRIPKEDILLPPNFQFTHGQQVTTPFTQEIPQRVRGDPTQQRLREQNQVTRIREELPRIRDEAPRVQSVSQRERVAPTTPRSRPSVIFPDEYEDDDGQNFINQHNSQVITEAPPPPPSRTRGRQPTVRTTTTTTEAPLEAQPPRTRAPSTRHRLRPTYNRPLTTVTTTTTTTTTTSTTPAPTFVEYPSQEYVDDYDNQQQFQQQSPSPPPSQTVAPVVTQKTSKPLSRFPPFPGSKSQEVTQEPVTTTTTPQSPPLHRQRPQVSQERAPGRHRQDNRGKGNRFRETSTPDSTTSPRTTGKPLYTTGRMLSKEGGLYAGQQITSTHVYGQPVPNVPINSVFDKVPGVVEGKSVVLATSKPNFGSPQKHLRSKQRPQPEHGPPKRVRPTVRAQQENTLDIVETVTLKPVEDQPKRLRAGNQFVRGQNPPNDDGGSQQENLPRRRKARPGQRRPNPGPHAGSSPDPYTETVSIHPLREIDDEETPVQASRAPVVPREPTVETTTSGSTSPRSRRPRPPRPGGKLNFGSQQESSTSERSREQAVTEDSENKPQRPVKKLRPRLRPVPQLTPQQQRGLPSEVVTQSQSAQVERKPTDAPGRFSSRFREDDTESSTASSSTGPSRFSPPPSRPTFKPPPPQKKTQQRKRPQQQQSGDSDELPDSIRLSPKDVIANRKPARRIPPGSASDRLKALQQRKTPTFNKPGQQQEVEETAEGRQVPVTKRPRLKPFVPATSQKSVEPTQDDDNQQLPQPQRLRKPSLLPRHQSQEATGNKREIVHKLAPQQNKLIPQHNDRDYYENDQENGDQGDDDDNSEYSADEQGSSSPASVTPQTERAFATATNRPLLRPNGGFQRNKSVEVTSDEARSVLGIPQPATPNRLHTVKKYQEPQHEEEDNEEDEVEEEEEAERQQFRQRPRFHSQQQTEQDRDRDLRPDQVEQPRQLQRPRLGTSAPARISQQRPRPRLRPNQQPEAEDEDENEQEASEYRDDDDKEEAPRKAYLPQQKKQSFVSSSTFSPSNHILRKQLKASRQRVSVEVDEEETEEDEGGVEVSSPKPSAERTTVTSTSTSSTSTSTSSSASPFPQHNSSGEKLPLALPVRAGPQPIKQGLLKSRLRPNRRLIGGGEGPQPRVSVTATTTQATITTTESRVVGREDNRQEINEEEGRGRGDSGLKHSTIHVSKSPRPRLHRLTGKRKEKKFIAMATENPSLPLESIFPEVS